MRTGAVGANRSRFCFGCLTIAGVLGVAVLVAERVTGGMVIVGSGWLILSRSRAELNGFCRLARVWEKHCAVSLLHMVAHVATPLSICTPHAVVSALFENKATQVRGPTYRRS